MKKSKLDVLTEIKAKKICCPECEEKLKNDYVLTAEDNQIIKLVCDRLTNKQIAQKLNELNKYNKPFTDNQVESRLSLIFNLLEVSDRVSLIVKTLTGKALNIDKIAKKEIIEAKKAKEIVVNEPIKQPEPKQQVKIQDYNSKLKAEKVIGGCKTLMQ